MRDSAIARVLMLIGVAQGAVWAQGSDLSASVRFEVASIRPNNTGTVLGRYTPHDGGRFEATNVTLTSLIRYAYSLKEYQAVESEPSWGQDRFDVVAKAEDAVGAKLTAADSRPF